ncbi:response regulator transcription factor [Stenotrophomonas sp. AB1(2024)]|uniref:response regulator transcription factor n=1 Tax=Stenotrophomonas sp. AB1(2024) TaxID=3132215 RepID=UPI0030952194
MKLRVFLADDHPMVLLGIRSILESEGIDVVGTATSTDALIKGLRSHPCDVVITDLMMPGGSLPDGTLLIQEIRAEFPLLPVLVMTMVSNLGIIDSLLRLGVLGVVEKTERMDMLVEAVRAVAKRRRFESPRLMDQLQSYRSERGNSDRLSPREAEVIRLLASGLSVSEIGVRLGRSLKTISRQKMDAMRKLGLESDVDLYNYARDQGMI